MQTNKYKFIDGGGLVGRYRPLYLWWIMADQDQRWKGIRSRWVLDCRTADLCRGMDGDLLHTGKLYFSYRLYELAFIVLSQMTRATLSKHFFFFFQVSVIRNIWNPTRRKYLAKLENSKWTLQTLPEICPCHQTLVIVPMLIITTVYPVPY